MVLPSTDVVINLYKCNMANWLTYRCKKCGFTVQTEPQGFYALISGMYYNFKCSKCKRIVDIPLVKDDNLPPCPYCGETNTLSTWNPIEGHCPNCGGEMREDYLVGELLVD